MADETWGIQNPLFVIEGDLDTLEIDIRNNSNFTVTANNGWLKLNKGINTDKKYKVTVLITEG